MWGLGACTFKLAPFFDCLMPDEVLSQKVREVREEWGGWGGAHTAT